MTEQIKNSLAEKASFEKSKILSKFFKTGKGEYGEGDIFIGVTVPEIRNVAKKFLDTPLLHIEQLLESPIHEHRMCALLILVEQYHKAKHSIDIRQKIVEFYLNHTSHINNWDLVDLSAPKILGEWLIASPDPNLLDSLSLSSDMWEQRIAIVSTLTQVRHMQYSDTLRLAKRYLTHKHPLIHKATGWLLREVGKKDPDTLLDFLNQHRHQMPRTALRYAIERLSPEQRAYYMAR